MEDTILHGGEKELLELKKLLQEKNRYNAVLDSMDTAVEEQKLKIEKRRAEIEKEMNLEVKRRREAVAEPFYEQIASCEAELQKALDDRGRKREEVVAALIQEEEESYQRRKDNLETQKNSLVRRKGFPVFVLPGYFLLSFVREQEKTH